jgi:hypothetical protein
VDPVPISGGLGGQCVRGGVCEHGCVSGQVRGRDGVREWHRQLFSKEGSMLTLWSSSIRALKNAF